jgi:hypothetical protein
MRRRRRNPKRSGSFLRSKVGKIVLAILAGAAVFFIYKKVKAAQLAQGTAPAPSGGGYSPPSQPQQLPPQSSGGGMAEIFPGSNATGIASNVTGEDFSNG